MVGQYNQSTSARNMLIARARLTTGIDLNTNINIMLKEELNYRPCVKNWMEVVQVEENAPAWRKRIVEWMFEASNEFKMQHHTVACAVNYLDRYLSKYRANKVMLQMFALVSLSLASKLHETQPMTMGEMQNLCRARFSKKELLVAEQQFVELLQWKLNTPTVYSFAESMLCYIENERDRRSIREDVYDVLQYCIKHHTYSKFLDSAIALSAIAIAGRCRNLTLPSKLANMVAKGVFSANSLASCQQMIIVGNPKWRPQIVVEPVEPQSDDLIDVRSDSPTSSEELYQTVSKSTEAPKKGGLKRSVAHLQVANIVNQNDNNEHLGKRVRIDRAK